MSTGVVVLSGGMDSVTLMHRVAKEGYQPLPITFLYGQKHATKEIGFAAYWADRFNVRHEIVDLRSVGRLLHKSALVNADKPVPEGHYADDNMKQTVVPNRNMIMLSIAGAYAVDQEAELIATGVHHGDHAIYPDCRGEFISYAEMAITSGNEGFISPNFQLYTPYLNQRKEDIALDGNALGVDWTRTWSCYKGGELHCGKCGTCVERKEAFSKAGLKDPTEYEGQGIPNLAVSP